MRRLPADLVRLALECEITPYRSSGPGGQKKNKTESSVRVTHVPTGVTRIATESRSQARNRVLALERIRDVLEQRSRVTPRRRATSRPASAEEARLAEKRRTAQRKRARGAVDPAE